VGGARIGHSRICAELDTDVTTFNTRDLGEQAFPYVFLDATYCKARVGGDNYGKGARVVSQAVVIATGVSADGRREVLGCAVGDSETEDFWTEFLRTLRDRGLSGIQLVVSDHHRGLMNAIETTLAGVATTPCSRWLTKVGPDCHVGGAHSWFDVDPLLAR
jgi:putative transposase